jgi:ferric-dicitrate binding protein FerR (iron transport regulator)
MNERESPLLPPSNGGTGQGETPDGIGAPLGEPLSVDPIGELVRLAGAREAVPRDRTVRVESVVHTAWAEAIAARRRQRLVVWGAAAVAAALAVAVGVVFWPRTPVVGPVVATVERVTEAAATGLGGETAIRPLAEGASLNLGSEVTTGREGRVAIRMQDGASLRLDVDSALTFLDADRVLLSAGAVYLDSEGGRPVTVETPWGEVEEHGTQFEVRLTGESVRVRVREGAVNLAGSDGSWEAKAGAELLLTASGRLSRGSVPFHGQAWHWVQEIAPPFELEGRSLADFLSWVGRETGWQIRWRDAGGPPAGIGASLHGSVEGMPPEQALAAVLPTCGLAHRLDGGVVTVFPSSPLSAP